MKNSTFVKEVAKACLASAAVSAAGTAGMVGGLIAVGAVINKINSKKS